MINFLELSPSERSDYITFAATQLGVSEVIIEKDFWVVFTLQCLFNSHFKDYLVFKGGTSLSKAYQIIQRFSEDIDLTIDRKLLGFDEDNGDIAEHSRKKQDAFIKNIIKNCTSFVELKILKELREIFANYLQESFELYIDPDDPLSIRFIYPQHGNPTYIKPYVYLEFGIRGALEPSEQKVIQSYLTQQITALKPDNVTVKTLSPNRTFFEKLTLLHAEANRPLDKPTPLRLSRHYYDLYCYKEYGIPDDIELLKQVIMHKNLYFKTSWANYQEIFNTGIQLINHERLIDLRKDYMDTKIMIFKDPPDFDVLISHIQEIERYFNKQILR